MDFINSFSLPEVQEQNRNLTGEMIVDNLKYLSKLFNAGINFYYSNSAKYRKYTRYGSFILESRGKDWYAWILEKGT
ncbi:MAG: hypothetical protein ACFFD4_38345 [Candidatus Odinarchaeota archaeon]